MAAQIVITRPSRDWARLRSYRVLLDGGEVLRLGRGESGDVEVTPGAHTLEARIDWASSPPLRVDVRDGETLRIECRAQPLIRAAVNSFIHRHNVLMLDLTAGEAKLS